MHHKSRSQWQQAWSECQAQCLPAVFWHYAQLRLYPSAVLPQAVLWHCAPPSLYPGTVLLPARLSPIVHSLSQKPGDREQALS